MIYQADATVASAASITFLSQSTKKRDAYAEKNLLI